MGAMREDWSSFCLIHPQSISHGQSFGDPFGEQFTIKFRGDFDEERKEIIDIG